MEDDRSDLLSAGLSLSLNHCHDPWIAGAAHRPLPTPSSTAPSIGPSLSLALPGDDASAGKAARIGGGSKVGEYSGRQSSPPRSMPSSFRKIKREDDGRCDDDDDRVEKVSSSLVSADEEEGVVDGGGAARKKLRLTKEQSALLEDKFREHTTLNPKQKQGLAKQLKLRPRQVEVWFQNRRARTKLKKTEVELEILRKCCETLTEENSRLQKELQELKYSAHKLSEAGPRYLQLRPAAAALRVCPSCKKVLGGDGATGSGAGRVAAGPGKTHFFNPFAHSAAC